MTGDIRGRGLRRAGAFLGIQEEFEVTGLVKPADRAFCGDLGEAARAGCPGGDRGDAGEVVQVDARGGDERLPGDVASVSARASAASPAWARLGGPVPARGTGQHVFGLGDRPAPVIDRLAIPTPILRRHSPRVMFKFPCCFRALGQVGDDAEYGFDRPEPGPILLDRSLDRSDRLTGHSCPSSGRPCSARATRRACRTGSARASPTASRPPRGAHWPGRPGPASSASRRDDPGTRRAEACCRVGRDRAPRSSRRIRTASEKWGSARSNRPEL